MDLIQKPQKDYHYCRHESHFPWSNISLFDTIADCDKCAIKRLSSSSWNKIELRTLPEPYHGNPDSDVYLLLGNPTSNPKDLPHVIADGNTRISSAVPKSYNCNPGYVNNYEKETCEELWHIDTEFLWLRDSETVVDGNGNHYPGYKWWKKCCSELSRALAAKNPNRRIGNSVFALQYFPYHAERFVNVLLPSGCYTDMLIYDAMAKGKIIVIVYKKKAWLDRIKCLAAYHNLIVLNGSSKVISKKNIAGRNPDSDWEKIENAL